MELLSNLTMLTLSASSRAMRICIACAVSSALLFGAQRTSFGDVQESLAWEQLPALPVGAATSGAFLGSTKGKLIIAGGAVEASPPQGPIVVRNCSDVIHVLDVAKSTWERGPSLPHKRAFGCSITTDEGLICIGGRDAQQSYADVTRIQVAQEADGLVCTSLPALPIPLTGACAARLANRVYVAGGHGVSNGVCTAPLQQFHVLDLGNLDRGWQILEPWPGPARTYAVAAAQSGGIYVFGGSRELDKHGMPVTSENLHDAYRFTPHASGAGGTWRSVASPPCSLVAVPSPAPSVGQSHVAFLGVDAIDQSQPLTAKVAQSWWYHTITNTWTRGGEVPEAEFAAPAVPWKKGFAQTSTVSIAGDNGSRILYFGPKPRKASLAVLDYVVIAGYFSLLPLIGWYSSRRSHGTEDFFLGGRRIPWWAAGISIYSTMLSGITYMGIPALSYAGNWTRMVAGLAIVMVAPIVVRYYVPFFCRLQVTSAYEYLELRFNLAARLITTSLFLMFQLGRVAIVVSLPALALSAVTGMSMPVCVLVTGVVATLYTYLGGIEAVIWVDVLQVAVLIGGAVLTLVSVVMQLDDGWASLVQTGLADGKFQIVSLDLDFTQTVLWVILIGGFFENLYSYSSDQTIIQRYLTTKDEASAVRSLWTNAALSLPCLLLFFTLGTALYAFYKSHPDQVDPLLPTDAVFPLFVAGHLPAGLVGLVIAGIFAASMDNLPSSVTCMTTAIVTDFFERFRPESTDRARLQLARALTVILGALGTCTALLMTQYDIKSQVDQYQSIIGLFAGGVAGIFALGVFTTRAHGLGGLAGLLGSALVQYFVATYTPLSFLLYSATGALSCFGIGYLVSILIPSQRRPLDGLTIHTLVAETSLSESSNPEIT